MRCKRKGCEAQCNFDPDKNEFWCEVCGWVYKLPDDDKTLEKYLK